MYQPKQYPSPHNSNDAGVGFKNVAIIIGASLLFFVLYSLLFPPKPIENDKNLTTQSVVETDKNAAPVLADTADSTKPAPISAPSANIISRIYAPDFDIEIDSLGRIYQVYLKGERFTAPKGENLASMLGNALGFMKSQKAERLERLPLLGENLGAAELRPLEMRFKDPKLNALAYQVPYTASVESANIENQSVAVRLSQNLGDLTIIKTLRFYADGSYGVAINLSRPTEYFLSNGAHPRGEVDEYTFKGVLLKNADETIEKIEDGDAEKSQIFSGAQFVASVDRYYASVFFVGDALSGAADSNMNLGADSNNLGADSKNLGTDLSTPTQTAPTSFEIIIDSTTQTDGEPLPYIKASGDIALSAYIGPKDYEKLKNIAPMLTDVVEYGIITFFAKPLFVLLEVLFDAVGNWGWAIVLLTIIVRLVLFPLTYKGMVSMQKLKELAPRLKDLQARHKDDPQRLQAAMMELYKKHGANPLGGCLPMLLQIPVFFAIYRVLYNAVELKAAPWALWISDLSAIDPYFILPLVMGLTMYISQSLTPTSFTDPIQEKVFKFLPLGFTIFFVIFPFPAGLVLYWSVNNVISIFQQLAINKMMEKARLKREAAK